MRPVERPTLSLCTGIKIDKSVPLPGARSARSPVYRAIESLDVGDSFLIPADFKSAQTVAAVGNRTHRDKRFVSRRTPDGFRVWRTS